MPGSNGTQENFATAVTEVSERVTVLVREEVELAKAEVTQKVTSLARGTVAVLLGAVFGVFALIFLLETAAWGLNAILDPGRRRPLDRVRDRVRRARVPHDRGRSCSPGASCKVGPPDAADGDRRGQEDPGDRGHDDPGRS